MKYKGLNYNIVEKDGQYHVITDCKFIPTFAYSSLPDKKTIQHDINAEIKKWPIVKPKAIEITKEDLDGCKVYEVI